MVAPTSRSRSAAVNANKQFASQLEDSESEDEPKKPTIPRSARRARRSTAIGVKTGSQLREEAAVPLGRAPKRRASTQSISRAKPTSLSSPVPSPEPPPMTGTTASGSGSSYLDIPPELVWAQVDTDYEPRDPLNVGQGILYWWPCKVTQRIGHELYVELCGNTPPSASSFTSVGSEYTRSFRGPNGQPRFQDFASATVMDSEERPHKLRKIELEDVELRWGTALETALKHGVSSTPEISDDDDLPDVSTAFSSTYQLSSMRSGGKSSRVSLISINSDSDSSLSDLSDHEETVTQDASLRIPGERILARSKREEKVFWPAMILEFCPSKNKKLKERERYRVKFLDDTERIIPRSFFWTLSQPRFMTCVMGEIDSTRPQSLVDDEDETYQQSREMAAREPSPALPEYPVHGVDFADLDLREQFSYTKPVMRAIMKDAYEPARFRRKGFMRGGTSRQNIVKEASYVGQVDRRDLPLFLAYLNHWCLREEAQADLYEESTISAIDPEDLDDGGQGPPPSQATTTSSHRSCSPDTTGSISTHSSFQDILNSTERTGVEDQDPINQALLEGYERPDHDIPHSLTSGGRQIGGEDYENLSGKEKLDFCVNVLLPEMLIQILLWRTGKRRQLDLLDPDEEEALHMEGSELLKQRDWVLDILNLRKLRQGPKTANGEAEKKRLANMLLESSEGRHTRSQIRQATDKTVL